MSLEMALVLFLILHTLATLVNTGTILYLLSQEAKRQLREQEEKSRKAFSRAVLR